MALKAHFFIWPEVRDLFEYHQATVTLKKLMKCHFFSVFLISLLCFEITNLNNILEN